MTNKANIIVMIGWVLAILICTFVFGKHYSTAVIICTAIFVPLLFVVRLIQGIILALKGSKKRKQ